MFPRSVQFLGPRASHHTRGPLLVAQHLDLAFFLPGGLGWRDPGRKGRMQEKVAVVLGPARWG